MLTWIAAILPPLLALLLRWLRMGKKCEPEKPEAPGKVKPIHLGQLSQVWTGEEKERVIRLEDLAKNRRKQQAVKVNEPERDRPVFSHPGINEFYRTMVDGKPNMTDNVLLCVEKLLKLLDREGACPRTENPNVLDAVFLAPGYVRRGDLSKHKLFVVLNACQVAAGREMLGGYAGLDAFLFIGASAVVAPLWSINDGYAREIAMSFYDRAYKDNLPPAEIFRSERARYCESPG